ncbi:hypothetical protein ACFV83_20665 [Streptomyces pharetrae]
MSSPHSTAPRRAGPRVRRAGSESPFPGRPELVARTGTAPT